MSKKDYLKENNKSKFFDTETKEQLRDDLREEIKEEVQNQIRTIETKKNDISLSKPIIWEQNFGSLIYS